MIRCGFILEADSMNLFPTPGPRWPLSTPLLTLAPGRWNDDLQQRGEQVSGGVPAPLWLALLLARGAPSLGEQPPCRPCPAV